MLFFLVLLIVHAYASPFCGQRIFIKDGVDLGISPCFLTRESSFTFAKGYGLYQRRSDLSFVIDLSVPFIQETTILPFGYGATVPNRDYSAFVGEGKAHILTIS